MNSCNENSVPRTARKLSWLSLAPGIRLLTRSLVESTTGSGSLSKSRCVKVYELPVLSGSTCIEWAFTMTVCCDDSFGRSSIVSKSGCRALSTKL